MGELISARAFAKLEGCAHTLVNRAIAQGRLRAVDVDGQRKIDADLVGSPWKKSNRMGERAAAAPQGQSDAKRKARKGDTPADDEPDSWQRIGEAIEKAPGKTFEEKAAHLATQGNLFRNLSEAELRKQTFLALMAEHKYNVEIGAVVPVASIAEIVGEKFAAVRTRILAIPGEEAPRVHCCKTVAEVKAILQDVVTAALEEISSGDIAGDIPARA